MAKALCLLRDALHYRKAAFCAGLQAAGYTLADAIPRPAPDDVLVIWNRYGGFHEHASRFEVVGARVLVAENGYLGKSWRGGEWFALAEGHHGGAGRWPYGGPERWDGWGVDLAQWRTYGNEVVILGQRGIGEPGLGSPPGWEYRVRTRFQCPARIRPHPGVKGGANLLNDLKNAQAVVTWSSGAALLALMAGIPVWRDNSWWIGAKAAAPIGDPLMRDDDARLEMFRRLAWANWTLEEVRTGEPFAWLMKA